MVKNSFFIEKSGAGGGGRERFWQWMCDLLLQYLPQTGILGWIVEEFCPLKGKSSEKSHFSCLGLQGRLCSFSVNSAQVTCGLSWRQGEEHVWSRSFLNPKCWATLKCSHLGREVTFYVLSVCTLEVENSWTSDWITSWKQQLDSLAVCGSGLSGFPQGRIDPLVWTHNWAALSLTVMAHSIFMSSFLSEKSIGIKCCCNKSACISLSTLPC